MATLKTHPLLSPLASVPAPRRSYTKRRSGVRSTGEPSPAELDRVRALAPRLRLSEVDARVAALEIGLVQANMEARLGRPVDFAVAALDWLVHDGKLAAPVLLGEDDYRALLRDCRHDPLTGLLNRRALYEALERELGAASRHGHAVAVLFLDLDGFKRFNDDHGHAAGDELLRELGTVLAQQTRAGDFAARYGGDELVVVGRQTGYEEALRLARRLRRAVRERWGRDGVTASIGVAIAPQDGSLVDELIAAADDAMYAAKHRGGNALATALEVSNLAR